MDIHGGITAVAVAALAIMTIALPAITIGTVALWSDGDPRVSTGKKATEWALIVVAVSAFILGAF